MFCFVPCPNVLLIKLFSYHKRDSLVAQTVKRLPAMQETGVRSPGREDPLEKEMATRSRILPGESHGQRSLAGYNAKGHKELDETEHACTQAVIDFLP